MSERTFPEPRKIHTSKEDVDVTACDPKFTEINDERIENLVRSFRSFLDAHRGRTLVHAYWELSFKMPERCPHPRTGPSIDGKMWCSICDREVT